MKAKPKSYEALREKAKALLKNKDSGQIRNYVSDIETMLEELRLYHTEIEIQNEELQISQKELAISRQKYLSLYDTAPISYVTLNEKGVIQEANTMAAQLLATSKAFLFNAPFIKYVDKISRNAFFQHLKKTFETRQKQQTEIALQNKENQRFHVKLQSIVLDDTTPQNQFCQTAIIDLTEQKNAEQALRDHQNKLNALFDSSVQIFHLISPTFKILYYNKTARQFYQTLANRTIEIGDPVLLYIPRKQIRKFREYFGKCLNGHIVKEKQVVEVRGQQRVFQTNFLPVYDQNQTLIGVSYNLLDITGRTRTEQAMRESEERFRSLFESSPDAIFVARPDNGVIVDANRAALQLLNCSREEVVGEHHSKLHPQVTRNKSADSFQRHLNRVTNPETNPDADNFFLEDQIITKDKKIIPVEISAQLIVIDNEKLIQGVFRDISERKQAEKIIQNQNEELQIQNEELAASNQKLVNMYNQLNSGKNELKRQNKFLEVLMDTLPNPLYYKTIDGAFIGCNQSFCQFVNTPRSEINNRTVHQLFPQKYAAFFEEYDHKLTEDKETKGFQMHFESADNTTIMHVTQTLFHNPDGSVAGILGIMEDITVRQQHENALHWELDVNNVITMISKAMIDTSKTMEDIAVLIARQAKKLTRSHHAYVGAINPKTKALQVSTFSKMLKTCPVQPEPGKSVCFFPDTDGTYNSLWGHSLNTKQGFFTNQPSAHFSSIGVPEGHIPLQNFLSVPALLDGEAVGQIAIANSEKDYNEKDLQAIIRLAELFALIIARRRMENELVVSKQAAEAANQAKSNFLANMSHEIRTPLNAILGFAQIMKGKLPPDNKLQSYIEGIKTSGTSLLHLITDILDLAKVETGQLKLRLTPVNLHNIIHEVEKIFAISIEDKGLRFEKWLDPDLPTDLLLDENRIRQVLFNLVGNAVKFTEQGMVRLSVKRFASPETKSQVDLVLEVRDTGIGIPEEQQQIIFKPFRQQKEQDTAKYGGGTGLGLSLTKHLVEMMNGVITVESQVGKGSKFSVFLENIEVSAIKNAVDSEAKEIKFKPATILLVEDIESNRNVIRGYLEASQLTIIEAENGREAIKKIKNQPPNLVLMDIQMPIMDGLKATKAIREMSKTGAKYIPVIALTAFSQDIFKNEKSTHGLFDGFIRKPVSKSHLIKSLEKFLATETTATSEKHDLQKRLDKLKEFGIADLPHKDELIKELTRLLPDYHLVQKKLSVNKIRSFAKQIKTIGEKHQIQPLIDYGNDLISFLSIFKFDKIIKLLSYFQQIYDFIQSYST